MPVKKRASSLKPPVRQEEKATSVSAAIKSSPATSLWVMTTFTLAATAAVLAVVAYSTLVKEKLLSSDWLIDEEFAAMSESVTCDFPILDIDSFDQEEFREVAALGPVLLRGMTANWTAKERWARPQFSKLYGDKLIKTGSGSSIVYGGGTASDSRPLNEMLLSMRTEEKQDTFSFDVSILQSIPEMVEDFRIPALFSDWDNPENERAGFSWHMLSLGASRTGLPFHEHGETWLALVHGEKRWFVYPPGYSLPSYALPKNPLEPVYQWLVDMYESLEDLDTPPLVKGIMGGNFRREEEDYRPLECVQQPGDVIFLPRGWSHMTMNVGEAIGIGGQAALPAIDRTKMARRTLQQHPTNFEALKASALGMAHLALDDEAFVRQHLRMTEKGVAFLGLENFQSLVYDSEDTWLVQYMSTSTPNSAAYIRAWNSVASQMKGFASIGAFDVTDVDANALREHLDIEKSQVEEAPIIRVYTGGPRPRRLISSHGDSAMRAGLSDVVADTLMGELLKNVIEGDVDAARFGIAYPGDVRDPNAIYEFAMSILTDDSRPFALGYGSVATLGCRARRLLRIALENIRMAVEEQPLQPEARGLMGEILGYMGDFQGMKRALEEAEAMYDGLALSRPENVVAMKKLDEPRVAFTKSVEASADVEVPPLFTGNMSALSLAAVYHKIGTTYLTQKLASEAVKVLEKSLLIQPQSAQTLIDLTVSLLMKGDPASAQATLRTLERYHPKHPALSDLSRYIDSSGEGSRGRRGPTHGPPGRQGSPGHGQGGAPGKRGPGPGPQRGGKRPPGPPPRP